MAFVTRMSILQELPRAVQNISQLLENFFEKAEQENYPNAAFARRTSRSRQVPHIALKQRRRVPRVRKPKAERQYGVHDGFAAAIKNAVRRTAFNTMAGPPGFLAALRAPRPLRLKPSGEFLKTAHWAVFLTEFHLIGSNPGGIKHT